MINLFKPFEKKVGYRWDLLSIAILMIIFGIAEGRMGFSHNFVAMMSTGIGVLFIVAGLFLLVEKRWAAALAIVLLAGDLLGRVILMITGYYPLGSALQVLAIILGTLMALVFALYIGLFWRALR